MPSQEKRDVTGHGTGIWYCPGCGYVDPRTTDVRCPKCTPAPLFREPKFGYYIRIGPEGARRSA